MILLLLFLQKLASAMRSNTYSHTHTHTCMAAGRKACFAVAKQSHSRTSGLGFRV
jgi:hypothetical protein